MATANPFDLLGDDDNDDPSQLVEKIVSAPAKKVQAAAPAAGGKAALQSAKLPSKPLPPAQAVKEARNEGGRGGRGGRGFGRGRGGGGFNRDSGSNENSFGNRGFSGDQGAVEESDGGKGYERRGGYGGPRGGFRGGRRGGFSNGDAEDGERTRRPYERRSGTGRGNEFKREGAGRGNWGAQADEITQYFFFYFSFNLQIVSLLLLLLCKPLCPLGESEEVVIEGEKTVVSDKPLTEEEATDEKKENAANEPEEKEPENKVIIFIANDVLFCLSVVMDLLIAIKAKAKLKQDGGLSWKLLLFMKAMHTSYPKQFGWNIVTRFAWEATNHVPIAKYPIAEMTLEEYQKVLEEKRKALEALKTEERKVEVDKELAAMQQLSNKKTNDDIFVKLGTDKDKRKEIAEKEERAKKSLSINEFLKPAVGERYYSPGGRGRGRGPRGGGRFNQGGSSSYAPEAPKIEDPSHFPTLGGK
ncbi:hypothetical protein OSB04_001529 [Centaurea solstitialis]|uniref:Hyaluronan/mRNA-binding protein domain-containing protein n=1 Tax=Centaurea solstitialis TaxID=347529 RepID=A0AA38TYN9_9ASTR|nr:hypothetical protein OSB04_001529 [Centaurea solstitialis]